MTPRRLSPICLALLIALAALLPAGAQAAGGPARALALIHISDPTRHTTNANGH
jgi:hypothetical protein